MIRTIIVATILTVCVSFPGAQTLTSEYLALVDSADNYIKAEKWTSAEEMVIKALRKEPANKSNYILWANLGMIRANREDLPGALQAYNIGLASAPRSTILLTGRAGILLSSGMKKEALNDLDLALETDSTLRKARRLRGLTLAVSGNAEAAEKDFSYYEKEYGQDAAIEDARGDICASAGKQQEAIEHYRTAYELDAEESTIVKLLTVAYLFNKLEEEEPTLNGAMRKYPRNGNLYLFRATINRRRYQTDAMESDLKTAKDLNANPILRDLLMQQ